MRTSETIASQHPGRSGQEDPVEERPSRTSLADPERWVDEYGDRLYGYALTRVRKPEVAEDLVQDTLLAALRSHERFDGRSSECSWLIGILKHKICDHFRKKGRESSFTDLDFFRDEQAGKFGDDGHWIKKKGPADWKLEGDEVVKRNEFWRALQECIDRLPERTAQVFMMREMDGVPSKEICNVLNISEANLWVMLHRARMALRQDLESTFFEGNRGTTL